MAPTKKQQQQQLAKDLWKEQSKSEPDPSTCLTLLNDYLEEDCDEKLLSACQKTFRLQRRNNSAENKQQWDDLLRLVQDRLAASASSSKKKNETEQPADNEDEDPVDTPPSSVAQYLSRLKRHQKDLYKNPPVLPPSGIVVYEERAPLPQRDPKTLRLRFAAAKSDDAATTKQLIQEQFRPNATPEEILRGGGVGGTYFRSIHSNVTNRRYTSSQVLSDSVDPSWIAGLDKKQYLTSTTYRSDVNKFGVKCGGSLGMWESSGWISDVDVYGWFQWYCRFYQGRRCSDDARQIQRWLGVAGPKGRFKSQLCNKILAAGGSSCIDDFSISPVIRQSLFHWGLLITKDVLEQHKKR